MTSIQGTGQAASTQYNHDPIQTSQGNPFYQPQLERLEESFLERMGDLSQQLEASQDPGEKLQIREEMGRLEGQFNMIRMHPEAGGPVTGAVPMDIAELISDMQTSLVQSYERFGTTEFPAEVFTCGGAERQPLVTSFIDSQVLKGPAVAEMMERVLDRLGIADQIPEMLIPKLGLGAPQQAEASSPSGNAADVAGPSSEGAVTDTSAASTEVAAADGADDQVETTDGVGGSEGNEVADSTDPQEMMELFLNDPEAFYDALNEVKNPEERMMLMNMVQTRLQQINQLFSMMSQFSQSVHDTQKAVINNLRV